MVNKQTLRQQAKARLTALSTEQRQFETESIRNELINSQEWQQANTIAVYLSHLFEMDTQPIIEAAWQADKQVVIPKMMTQTSTIDFFSFQPETKLITNHYGIQEPAGDSKPIKPDQIDLMIIPGLLFTPNGERLGFGGGYYDRYLKTYNNQTVSLAFTNQLVEKLPLEKDDHRINRVISAGPMIK